MARFTDSLERSWDVVVNVTNAKRVRDVLNVNVLDVYSKDVATQVFGDPILLVNILYVLCEKQCLERGIDDEGFGEGLVGDSLDGAADALLDAVAGFFPSAKSQTLRRINEHAKKVATMLEAQEAKTVEQFGRMYSEPASSMPVQ